MSHIHIPDGILPLWLWGLSYLIIFILFTILFNKKRIEQLGAKTIYIGIFAAIMLISMSFFVIPPFYHFTLASLSGIILGPVLALPAILSVNLFLSLVGHGGVSVIGLNTLVIYSEAVVAYFLTKNFYRLSGKLFLSVFISTLIALTLSLLLKTGIVYGGTRNLNYMMEHDHHSHHEEAAEEHEQEFDIKRFFTLLFTFGLIGWISESFITAFVVAYLQKVRPQIVEGILDENI